MKRLVIVLALLLAACQAPVDDMAAHCLPQDKGCALGEEGNRNVDLFDTINPELVTTQEVNYYGDANGFLAQPKAAGNYPGVIMIHEFWGVNDNIKNMAILLAQEGYVVLAADLYDGKVATTQDEARALAGAVRNNQPEATRNMRDAANYLRDLPNVDGNKIASMGWCFGGGQSLQLALAGEPLAATVIYYGNLVNDTSQLRVIKQPVLGIFGETDMGIPPTAVRAFEAGLNQVGVENDIYIYPNVGHAFANPSGARYAANETVDAWEKTVTFLNTHVK